jgi:NADH dehydrogenase FAD-containing subunit
MAHSTDPTIILGGGFTGLFTALHLSKHNYSQPTLLIDQQERFSFNPLLYEFLSGEMQDNQVWPYYKEILKNHDVKFLQDTVTRIDLDRRQVKLASGLRYTYKYLVLALGSTLKHLRNCFCRVTQTPDPEKRRALTTVVIVGGGSSGVELAATLADILPYWYSVLGGDPQEIRVVILERDTKILGSRENNQNSLQDTAQKALAERNVPVELLLGAKVYSVDPKRIEFQYQGQFESISTATVIWTAGVTTLPIIKELPIPDDKRDRQGRLHVTSTLQLPDFPKVFAGGDCAAMAENPLPPTAQVAYQQGYAIARNLKALSEGKEPSPANVKLRGTLMKLGLDESAAYLQDRYYFKGRVGHFIRQTSYLELLPTPMYYNLKSTAEWLVEAIFQQYSTENNLTGVGAMSRH